MFLPLPKVVADVGPGGPLISAMRGMNEYDKEKLTNKLLELQNQFYAPQAQADVDYKNALTSKIPLENEHQQLVNQFYGPNIQSEISSRNALRSRIPFENQLTQQQIEEAKIRNQFLPESLRSEIGARNELSNYRKIGGPGMGTDQKAIYSLQKQLQMDNPTWDDRTANQAAGAYLNRENSLGNGMPLPKLSGIADQMLTGIRKKNSTAVIQNTAANMDITAQDLNEIPIEAISKFSGPLGKLDYANELRKMQTNPSAVSDDFRKYKSYQDVISTFSMDTLRKGFGTSVVPDYVYDTLGKALNPQSSWWNDPKQVSMDLNKVKKWVNDNARRYKIKADKGATADISNNDDRLGLK